MSRCRTRCFTFHLPGAETLKQQAGTQAEQAFRVFHVTRRPETAQPEAAIAWRCAVSAKRSRRRMRERRQSSDHLLRCKQGTR
jgi:hypothetical protein